MIKKRKLFRWGVVVLFLVASGFALFNYLPNIFGDAVYPLKYAPEIAKYSDQYGVDPALVAAVILQESRFNPAAVSPKGAKGLMQFMPGTAATMAKEIGLKSYDLFDPVDSIQLGAAHLRDLLAKYNGNVDAALAGYNAGTGNADAWIRKGILGNIPFGETNNYVKKVKNYQKVYQTMYTEELKVRVPVNLKESAPSDTEVKSLIWGKLFENVFGLVIKQ